MQENEKNPQEEQLAEVKSKSVSAFENARMAEAQMQREAELAERARQAAENEAAYQAREEYARELNEEKIDLIRLRQGVITESDKVFPEQAPQKKYTVSEKIGNWLYHSKWWLGIAIFCVAVGGFLLYDHLTKVDADVNILMLTNDYVLYSKTQQLCDMAQKNLADYNGDEQSVASVIFVPVSKDTMETGSFASSYNTQLLVQLQSDMCMLVIADIAADAYMDTENLYVDLETMYPQYDFIEGSRVMLAETSFSDWLALEEPLNDGAYLALRQPTGNMSGEEEMQQAYNEAVPVLESLLEQLASKPDTAGGEAQ